MSKIEDSIKKYEDGAIINIFVKTKSQKAIFPSGYNEWRKRIEIEICSEPIENKANLEIIKVIANYLSKTTKDVVIISGEKNKEKTLYIKNIFINEILKKIRKSLDGL